MAQHIGIVACSAEGAALCYRTICLSGAELLGSYDHPEITMHTHSLGEYMKRIDRGDWKGVGELILSSANKLAAAGADFLICPDNTIHQALPLIDARLPRPWVHIAQAVAARAKERQWQKLGLTGTRWLVESEVYPSQLKMYGLDYLLPTPEQREAINHIIMEELVHGIVRPEAVETFQNAIERMKTEGCDAVILGCTEIPLLINDGNSPLPTLDSTRLLAHAALSRALQTTPGR